MTLRGKAAIVGIGELPTRRSYPARSMYGLCAEAARMAMEDAKVDLPVIVVFHDVTAEVTLVKFKPA